MKIKKLQGTKECDPGWITEIAKGLLDRNINNLSEYQKKILKDMYFENLHNGLKPKEAIKKALEIVLCFDTQKVHTK